MSYAMLTVDEVVDLIYTEYHSQFTQTTGQQSVRNFVTDALNDEFRHADWSKDLDIAFMLAVAVRYAEMLKADGRWDKIWE